MTEHNGWTRASVIEFVAAFQNRKRRVVKRDDFRYLPGFPRPLTLNALFGSWREFREVRPAIGPAPKRTKAPSPPKVVKLQPAKSQTAKAATAHTGGERVSIEPFAQWIEGEVAVYGPTVVAEQMGVADRRLREYVSRAFPTICLDTVDRALIHYGETNLLNELYPCELPLALVA